MKRIVIVSCIVAVAVASFGCSSKKGTGALIGAGAGAAAGAAIGNNNGNTALGAIIGAAVGGAAGAAIGSYMDNQAEELEQIPGARVERVGEGIHIVFDSGILFAVDSSDLTGEAKGNLGRMATVLNKYPDTELRIEGHTDSTGEDAYNQALSRRRAQSVKSYLGANAVRSARMVTFGYGESAPAADNSTSAGRAQNRRVEVAIVANDELKERYGAG